MESILDLDKHSLNATLEVLKTKEEIFGALKEEIQGLKKWAEECMVSLALPTHQHVGYSLFFRANSPRHSMNWRRFQKDHGELYKHFREEGIVSLSSPTKAQSLVFAKKEGQ